MYIAGLVNKGYITAVVGTLLRGISCGGVMQGSSVATRETFALRPLYVQGLQDSTHTQTAEGARVGGMVCQGRRHVRDRGGAYVEVMRNRESASHNRQKCSEKESANLHHLLVEPANILEVV